MERAHRLECAGKAFCASHGSTYFLQTFSGPPIPSPAEEESPAGAGGAGEFMLCSYRGRGNGSSTDLV